jgi:hypothetical protein
VNQLIVVDIKGRIIQDFYLNSLSNPEIDISNLQKGIYFLKIISQKGVIVEKVILY